MKIDKKAINYYYSFFEVSKELNQKQFYDFNMAIYKVMFFELHINEVEFKDSMLTILWKSIKHSLQASVKGYCDKKSIPYDEYFAPLSNPLDNNIKRTSTIEQEKEQVVVKKPFSFSLSKDIHYSNLSMEYKETLKVEILKLNGNLQYEDFILSLETTSKYKYKNFLLVYKKWNKNTLSQNKPISFKQQDEIRDKEKSKNISRLLDSGFNPFLQSDWDKLSEYETKLMQNHQQGYTDVQLTN